MSEHHNGYTSTSTQQYLGHNMSDDTTSNFELDLTQGPCVILDTLHGVATHILQPTTPTNPTTTGNSEPISLLSNFEEIFNSSDFPSVSSSCVSNSCHPQHVFLNVVHDLPFNSMFALSSDKLKVVHPRLPPFSVCVQNCSVLLKLMEKNHHFILSCHIAAFKDNRPDSEFDVITFNEEALNHDMSFQELFNKHAITRDDKLMLDFHPSGNILNSKSDMSNYSHFVINFQLINNGTILMEQLSLSPFKIPNIIFSMKEDFSSSSKYIIGSLAGRSDSLIKQGSRKIPSPISVKISKPLLDQYFNSGSKDLYLNVYVRGEDASSMSDSSYEHNHSDQYCLLKHGTIKLKHNIYTYSIDEELGKLEKGEKKPQKSKFRLGIVLTTKFHVKNKDFSNKIIKYKTLTNRKLNPSILGWTESSQFSCATRQEICIKGSKRGRNEIDSDSCSSAATSALIDDSSPQTPHVKSLWSCVSGNSSISSGTPVSTTSSSIFLNNSSELKRKPNSTGHTAIDNGNLVQSLVEMRNEFSKSMELQISIQREFEIKSQCLIDMLEDSLNATYGSPFNIVPVCFDTIFPDQGKEGSFVCIQTSNDNLTSSMSFSVLFNGLELPESGGVISNNCIAFKVPPKPNPKQDVYSVKVISRKPSTTMAEGSCSFSFTYV